MASNSSVIREFLVSLNYKVTGKQDFVRGVEDVTVGVVKLGLEVKAASLAVVGAVTVIAAQLDRLFYASRRTGSSVGEIQAFSFAVSQMGGSAEGAQGSLESLARFLRSSPGAGGLIESWGVAVRDANGHLRGSESIIESLAEKFRQMPYWMARVRAEAVGIDERTLMAMLDPETSRAQAEYRTYQQRMGMNPDTASKSGRDWMREIRSTLAVFTVLEQKIGVSLMQGIGGNVRKFRELILANSESIAKVIEWLAKAIVTLSGVITHLVTSTMDGFQRIATWFRSIDPDARKFLETIGVIAIAWRALNFVFSMSPIGRIAALVLALAGLYDDYKTWKDGGKSLIDWKEWEPGITAATNAIQWMTRMLGAAWRALVMLKKEWMGWTAADSVIKWALHKTGADDPNPVTPGAQRSDSSPFYAPTPDPAPGAMGVMGYIMSHGWNHAAAAGITAGLQMESGFDPTQQFTEANGSVSKGIAQWSPARRAAIEAHFGKSVENMSLREQIDARLWEIATGADKGSGEEGNLLRRPDIDADAAGQADTSLGERPFDPLGNKARARGALAKRLDDMHSGLGGGAPSTVVAPAINQTNNLTVNTASDPQSTSNAVHRAISRANQDLVRNTAGALR